jgi:metallophosphoesterase (TIGR03767 family)
MSRRAFLRGTAASAALAGIAGWSPSVWTPARARALRATLATSVNPAGTTLAETIVRAASTGYSGLTYGPGWPTVVRTELATPRSDRADRRVPLASIVHLTDVHLIDAQSPGRVEFLDPLDDPFTAAFRPQETLTAQVQSSMVQRINALGAGPVTGRPFDCAVSTGDNIDNQQWNELQWFLTVLDGGLVHPNSGAPGVYEGVQDATWGDPRYWHPEPGASDIWRTDHGFGDYPGLLAAAITPFSTPALSIPWYSTYGNHDGLIQGNLPTSSALDDLLTSQFKITDLKPGQSVPEFLVAMFTDAATIRDEVFAGAYPHRVVTPDPDRRTVKTREWVQAHLDSPPIPGPAGHGYTPDHLALPALYYEFQIAPGVLGISMDTGGYNSGTIGQVQLDWIEQTLQRAHSRYFDSAGNLVRTGNSDQLVILFSHFNMRTMQQSLTDPNNPTERRYTGDELVSVLHRYPNIVAWVNGHHHVNQIEPIPDPTGRTQGFWDINTCSHVDWPSMARIIELVDNNDGTLSLFCTMIEHAAPAETDPNDLSVLGLAAISRELAANDFQSDLAWRLGRAIDLNVELVIPAPYAVTPPPAAVPVPVAQPVFTG